MKHISIILGFLLLFTGNLTAAIQYNLYQRKNTSFDYNLLYNNHSQSNTSKQEQRASITAPKAQNQVTIKTEMPPLVANDVLEEYSNCIKQATKLYIHYVYYTVTTRHSNAFLNVIKRTKQNPTAENIADLKNCMSLINKFGNGSQSSDALEKKLKSTKGKDEQMKIFIEEAKQSNK